MYDFLFTDNLVTIKAIQCLKAMVLLSVIAVKSNSTLRHYIMLFAGSPSNVKLFWYQVYTFKWAVISAFLLGCYVSCPFTAVSQKWWLLKACYLYRALQMV